MSGEESPSGILLADKPVGLSSHDMVARARRALTVFVARDGARASAFIHAMAFFAPEIEIVRRTIERERRWFSRT